MSYNQPPPPYAGHPPPPGPTMVISPGMQFGEHPIPMTCPFCHTQIVTGTTYTSGMFTWIIIGSICLVGAMFVGITWLGCCLIPCCINSCKDVEHNCPSCHRIVGKYDRLKNM